MVAQGGRSREMADGPAAMCRNAPGGRRFPSWANGKMQWARPCVRTRR